MTTDTHENGGGECNGLVSNRDGQPVCFIGGDTPDEVVQAALALCHEHFGEGIEWTLEVRG